MSTATPSANVTNVSVLGIDGNTETVGTPSVVVLMRDPSNDVLAARGATLPSDADAGYAKGCTFIVTGGSNGTTFYVNEGSATSASFKAMKQTALPLESATIATTGNTDAYILAPVAGVLTAADFSGVDALAADDTNYITFSITNLGQAGAGSTAMLAATAANTTKTTGGSALAANTKRSLTLHGTAANLVVAAGDRLRIRAAATGTLANTVTFPTYQLRFA